VLGWDVGFLKVLVSQGARHTQRSSSHFPLKCSCRPPRTFSARYGGRNSAWMSVRYETVYRTFWSVYIQVAFTVHGPTVSFSHAKLNSDIWLGFCFLCCYSWIVICPITRITATDEFSNMEIGSSDQRMLSNWSGYSSCHNDGCWANSMRMSQSSVTTCWTYCGFHDNS